MVVKILIERRQEEPHSAIITLMGLLVAGRRIQFSRWWSCPITFVYASRSVDEGHLITRSRTRLWQVSVFLWMKD